MASVTSFPYCITIFSLLLFLWSLTSSIKLLNFEQKQAYFAQAHSK